MNGKRIVISVSSGRFMRWQSRLRDRLAKRWPESEVLLRFTTGEDSQPSAVDGLLALERLLMRRGQPTLCDRIDTPDKAPPDAGADVVVDLIGAASPGDAARVLQPLYDGHATDQAAVAAILSGAIPTLAVEDAASGACIVEGLPSFEAADGLTGGLEAVYSRICVLLEKALAEPETACAKATPAAERRPRHPAVFFARSIAFQCARRLYHLCCYSPHWRIGWRFVDGPGALESGSLSGAKWRVMPDQGAAFSADPFPIEWRGRTGVFYEQLDYRSNIGEIFYQPFDAAGPAGAPIRALGERWHLSYPFLIEEEGVLYMLPEASLSGAITLYRCVEFPQKWEPVATLVANVEAADATIFRHGGRYWMTAVIRDGYGGYSDTLALYHAPSLFGPWEPHRRSPVLVDARFARPAGAVVSHEGALFRPAQNCAKGYGKEIAIMRIDALNEETFSQSLISQLAPGRAWPGGRLHTLNRSGRLECIDGAVFTPKPMTLRRVVHQRIDAVG